MNSRITAAALMTMTFAAGPALPGSAAALDLGGARTSVASVSPSALAKACAINVSTGKSGCAATPEAAHALVASADRTQDHTLATFYENINYGPAGTYEVLNMYGQPCTTSTTDIEYTISNLTLKKLRDVTWNDRISSVKTFKNCDVKFFEHTHGAGASTSFIDSNSNLGTYPGGWNDRASSIRLS